VFPDPFANDPGSAGMHELAPLFGWYEPAGHGVADVFPVPGADDPAGAFVQAI
jgi:hypothetical protein